MKILVVEDERELLANIAQGLRLLGYAVDTADNGDAAEELALVNQYDLIVLDINLPGQDGFTVLESIRRDNKTVNIIMLTARAEVSDRVKGFDLGANDYLIKPFHFEELEARVRSLLRRRQILNELVLSSQGILFDTKSKRATLNGETLRLTGKESGILEYLLINQGRYVSQEELLQHVWEDGINEFSNTARVHVYSLRKKLKEISGKNIVRNEIGRGYIID